MEVATTRPGAQEAVIHIGRLLAPAVAAVALALALVPGPDGAPPVDAAGPVRVAGRSAPTVPAAAIPTARRPVTGAATRTTPKPGTVRATPMTRAAARTATRAGPVPPGGDPGVRNLHHRLDVAYISALPAAWRSAVPIASLGLTDGVSSLSWPSGVTVVARIHATGRFTRLQSVLAREWAHHLAFAYGTRAYSGARPAGFPQRTRAGQETWADCVSWAAVGRQYRYDNVPPCSAGALRWTRQWLASGPGGHRRTR